MVDDLQAVGIIFHMNFLSIDIQLAEPQETECVVDNQRAVGLSQRSVD